MFDNLIISSLPASVYIINLLLIVFIIFYGRNKNPRSTLLWIMLMALLPIVGFVFYLVLGQDFRSSKRFELKTIDDDYISEMAKYQIDLMNKGIYPFKNPKIKKYDQLLLLNLGTDDAVLTENNEVNAYFDGNEYFPKLFKDIKNAKESIEFQSYVFKYDGIGKTLVDLLEEKAEEGLEVRVLIDGIGGRTLLKSNFETFIKKGGKLSIFAPTYLRMINPRINYRNHRKIAIIDKEIGYVGGFNVSDDYIGKKKKLSPWRDTQIRIKGESVIGLRNRFLKDFRFSSGEKLELSEHRSDAHEKNTTGIQIISSGPDTEFENVKNAMVKMIYSAEKEVLIQTPYFVPDDSVLDALVNAKLSGVEVSIMIPANQDNPFVHWVALSYLGKLLDIGVKTYLFKKGFNHSKIMIVDEDLSTVGSANMDIRSFSINFETNAIIYDKALNADLRRQFEKDILNSEELTKEVYEKRSKVVKTKEAFSRLFAPIL